MTVTSHKIETLKQYNHHQQKNNNSHYPIKYPKFEISVSMLNALSRRVTANNTKSYTSNLIQPTNQPVNQSTNQLTKQTTNAVCIFMFVCGPIGASIVAMSPRTMLDLNPALAMGKPTFESKGPPITSKDIIKETTRNSGDTSKKNFL